MQDPSVQAFVLFQGRKTILVEKTLTFQMKPFCCGFVKAHLETQKNMQRILQCQ